MYSASLITSQRKKLSTNEAMTGPAVKSRKPRIQGVRKTRASSASRFSRPVILILATDGGIVSESPGVENPVALRGNLAARLLGRPKADERLVQCAHRG